MPNVLITREPSDEIRQIVKEHLSSEASAVFLSDLAEEERAGAFEAAEVLAFYMIRQEIRDQEMPLISGIPFLQSIPAGVERLPYEHIGPDTIICANAGAWAWPLAEYVMGLIIALDKEILSHTVKLADGIWDRSNSRCLRGRSMGIIGFGGIGQATAKLARAFGLKIMAINRSAKTDEPVDFIGTESDMDKVLAESDVMLLSTPLTKKTRGMISARELDLMKDDAVLINVGRGPLVDEDALFEHMKCHPDFKFGADVWWREPGSDGEFSLKHPHFDSTNIMGTPHNADHVEGMLPEALGQAMQNINRYLKGEPLHGVVNRVDYE